MVAKQLLIGKVAAPTIDTTELQHKAENLRERLRNIKTTSPTAFAALLAAWSPAMPTLKTDHQHTAHQLREIEQLLNTIEGDHSVPFGKINVKRPPTRKKKTPVATAELPSETLLIDNVTVAALRERLNNTDPETQKTARTIAKQAAAVQRSISLSGKPSLRRAMLVEFMIEAIEEADGKDHIIAAIVDHCGYYVTNVPIGAILGNLDLDQITQMSTTLTQIRDGDVAITYNTNTDTYSVQKAATK